MLKTSQTHPLQVQFIQCQAPGSGRIGMTFCPGKKQKFSSQGDWDRNLDLDLAVIREHGATHLVTLMEYEELFRYGVASLPEKASQLFAWHHLPWTDGGVPHSRWEILWQDQRRHLLEALAKGETIVIHCRGGLGRTGTLAARLLVELGEAPEVALRRVRTARPGAVENGAQEAYVLNLRPSGRLTANDKMNSWPESPCRTPRDGQSILKTRDMFFQFALFWAWKSDVRLIQLTGKGTRSELRFLVEQGDQLDLFGPRVVLPPYDRWVEPRRSPFYQSLMSNFNLVRKIGQSVSRGNGGGRATWDDELLWDEDTGFINNSFAGLPSGTPTTVSELPQDHPEIASGSFENRAVFCPLHGTVEPRRFVLSSVRDSWQMLAGREVTYLLCPDCGMCLDAALTKMN